MVMGVAIAGWFMEDPMKSTILDVIMWLNINKFSRVFLQHVSKPEKHLGGKLVGGLVAIFGIFPLILGMSFIIPIDEL